MWCALKRPFLRRVAFSREAAAGFGSSSCAAVRAAADPLVQMLTALRPLCDMGPGRSGDGHTSARQRFMLGWLLERAPLLAPPDAEWRVQSLGPPRPWCAKFSVPPPLSTRAQPALYRLHVAATLQGFAPPWRECVLGVELPGANRLHLDIDAAQVRGAPPVHPPSAHSYSQRAFVVASASPLRRHAVTARASPKSAASTRHRYGPSRPIVSRSPPPFRLTRRPHRRTPPSACVSFGGLRLMCPSATCPCAPSARAAPPPVASRRWEPRLTRASSVWPSVVTELRSASMACRPSTAGDSATVLQVIRENGQPIGVITT